MDEPYRYDFESPPARDCTPPDALIAFVTVFGWFFGAVVGGVACVIIDHVVRTYL